MEFVADLENSKYVREADMFIVERLEREITDLIVNCVNHSNNLSEMSVTRKVLEDIQNQNHILQPQIYYLSEHDIRTENKYPINDVISPTMGRKVEDIIWKL